MREDHGPSRDEARGFVAVEAARCSSDQLFTERTDGHFVVEVFNWPPARQRDEAG
ncbi:MAG: hypothetical protein U1E53_12390 [Dongiaceae bacterium]